MSFKIQNHTELTQVETKQDTALGIMRWGTNNSFPQTLKNLIEQSPVSKPAVERTARFLKGGHFEGENEIVSPYGLTLKQVVSIMAENYAVFKAFALHANQNIMGENVGMNPMQITDLRFQQFDELNFSAKIGYHPNFGGNSEVRKTVKKAVTKSRIKWIDRYNPNVVVSQIEATKGGIGNYNGQILYHSDTGHSSYPVPPLQACINYVLADVENSILARKETATGFINSYILKTTLDYEDPKLAAIESAIEDAQGARGSGKVITITGLNEDELKSTLIEELGGSSQSKSVIDSVQTGYELYQKVIQGAYLIPPILAGADQKSGFSAPNLMDAYLVFNKQTEDGRAVIENAINRILKDSVFDIKEIKLTELTFDVDITAKKGENNA